MMKSLQSKFLLIFMFALILNLLRINMAYSDEQDEPKDRPIVEDIAKMLETKITVIRVH